MRWMITACILSGCYSPQLAPCAVHCQPTSPCPDSLECGADLHCHEPGDSRVCPQDFLLKITKPGTGNGLVSGDLGIDCGTSCMSSAAPGTAVLLTTTPDTDSRFVEWTGACSGMDVCHLTLDADKTVGARFNLTRTLSVAFVIAGTGSVVTSMPSGLDCTANCSADFDDGTTVTLTPIPDPLAVFIGWESGPCSGTSDCTMTLSSDVTIIAHFE